MNPPFFSSGSPPARPLPRARKEAWRLGRHSLPELIAFFPSRGNSRAAHLLGIAILFSWGEPSPTGRGFRFSERGERWGGSFRPLSRSLRSPPARLNVPTCFPLARSHVRVAIRPRGGFSRLRNLRFGWVSLLFIGGSRRTGSGHHGTGFVWMLRGCLRDAEEDERTQPAVALLSISRSQLCTR